MGRCRRRMETGTGRRRLLLAGRGRAAQTARRRGSAPAGAEWQVLILLLLAHDETIALILGVFTGIAAFGGSLMNWSFVMAGTASTNMLLFALAVLLMLAWKVAGWYGLDR